MKHFKKILAFVLCAVLLCGVLAGCGGNGADTSSETSSLTTDAGQSLGGFGQKFVMKFPSGKFYYTNAVDIQWTGLKANETVTLIIEQKQGDKFVPFLEKTGLTGTSYTDSKAMPDGDYRITLKAVSKDGAEKLATNTKGEGLVVTKATLKSNAEVNKGLDFKFDGKISEKVLNNYLSRAITYGIYSESDATLGDFDSEMATDAMRAILSVGAKHIARTVSTWIPSATEESGYPEIEAWITKMHSYDPEIVFEACIFETATAKMNTIKIPDWVFKAFGKKDENRNFDVSKMLHDDKFGFEQWGSDLHVPDITKEETQMWFYYRACNYIDMGFESLHLGQTNLIGQKDGNLSCWTKVIHMIRDYAKKNARRHYVIINGHYPTQKFVGTDGVMLVDFNAFPLRLKVAAGEKDHAVSENNPQKCEINMNGDAKALYTGAISGKSPSGWTTNHYPYLVEFDNDGGDKDDHTKVSSKGKWGYDEISWIANQPQWYRHKFMKDVTAQVNSFKNNGHVVLPGRRTAFILGTDGQSYYVMNDSKFYKDGFSDEAGIIAAWK